MKADKRSLALILVLVLICTVLPVPAAQARLLRLLRKSLVIDVVLLIDDTHGVQHRSHDAAAGGTESHPQIRQTLVQLLRRQP